MAAKIREPKAGDVWISGFSGHTYRIISVHGLGENRIIVEDEKGKVSHFHPTVFTSPIEKMQQHAERRERTKGGAT